MLELVSRQARCDLVWSEPVTALTTRFGVSGPAIAKACYKLHIPTPPRGFWARKAALKLTIQSKLPARPPGAVDGIIIRDGRYWRYYQPHPNGDELLRPIPPEPTFEEPIAAVRQRVESALNRAPNRKSLAGFHPVIARLLQEDTQRQEAAQTACYVVRGRNPVAKRR